MIGKLQRQLMIMVLGSVFFIMLTIGIAICVFLYNTSNDTVHKALVAATEEASRNVSDLKKQNSSVLDLFLNGEIDSISPGLPNGTQKSRGRGPALGGKSAESEQIPVATYYLNNDGLLEESPNGTMTAYINQDVLEYLGAVIKSSEEGIHESSEFDVVYCKVTVDDVVFVSFTDLYYVYS